MRAKDTKTTKTGLLGALTLSLAVATGCTPATASAPSAPTARAGVLVVRVGPMPGSASLRTPCLSPPPPGADTSGASTAEVSAWTGWRPGLTPASTSSSSEGLVVQDTGAPVAPGEGRLVVEVRSYVDVNVVNDPIGERIEVRVRNHGAEATGEMALRIRSDRGEDRGGVGRVGMPTVGPGELSRQPYGRILMRDHLAAGSYRITLYGPGARPIFEGAIPSTRARVATGGPEVTGWTPVRPSSAQISAE